MKTYTVSEDYLRDIVMSQASRAAMYTIPNTIDPAKCSYPMLPDLSIESMENSIDAINRQPMTQNDKKELVNCYLSYYSRLFNTYNYPMPTKVKTAVSRLTRENL